MEQYLGSDNLNKNEIHWDDIADAPGNENIKLKSIAIKHLHGVTIDVDSGIEISTVFFNTTAGKSLDFTLNLFTLDGVCLFETGIILSSEGNASTGFFSTRCLIPPHIIKCRDLQNRSSVW